MSSPRTPKTVAVQAVKPSSTAELASPTTAKPAPSTTPALATSANPLPVASAFFVDISSSGAARSRGLRPDSPVLPRTFVVGPSGPPPHLIHLASVWHTFDASTQDQLSGISFEDVETGLELARSAADLQGLVLAEEEYQRTLRPLLQESVAISFSIVAARREHGEHMRAAHEARARLQLLEAAHRENVAAIASLTVQI